MKDTPADWPRFSSAIVYRDAAAAIDWLCDAFGFGIRIKVEGENGRIEHCELEYGDGVVMIAQESPDAPRPWKRSLRSPRSVEGANTQSLMFYVDDADSHCAHARSREAHDSRLRRRTLGGSKLRRARPRRSHLVGGTASALVRRRSPLDRGD